MLFNLILEVRGTGIITSNYMFTKSSQLKGFADDLDFIGRNMEAVKNNFVGLEMKGSDFGLKVKDEKTEYMIISPSNICGQIAI